MIFPQQQWMDILKTPHKIIALIRWSKPSPISSSNESSLSNLLVPIFDCQASPERFMVSSFHYLFDCLMVHAVFFERSDLDVKTVPATAANCIYVCNFQRTKSLTIDWTSCASSRFFFLRGRLWIGTRQILLTRACMDLFGIHCSDCRCNGHGNHLLHYRTVQQLEN